jgi:SAM-dependent methyltransferase
LAVNRSLLSRALVEDRVYEQLYELEDQHWWFRGRRAVVHALLRRHGMPPSPRVLDAGCGTGRNLLDYRALGRAEGIDSSGQAVAYCHRRGLHQVRQASLYEVPHPDASFDLLFATDVFEHVDDDVRALRELRRVASADARLIATVPAYRWLWSKHDDDHHHRRRYTRARLVRTTLQARWRPVQVTYFNTLLLPPIAAVRLLLPPGPGRTDYAMGPPTLERLLSLPMRLEALLIERGARLPAGVSIGMVCRPA